jgi:hypothetical protein
MTLYIRKSGSKPNHPGGYSKGYKIYKARNHTHIWIDKEKTNGQIIKICNVHRCKAMKNEG